MLPRGILLLLLGTLPLGGASKILPGAQPEEYIPSIEGSWKSQLLA
jgi:hypothetical protein